MFSVDFTFTDERLFTAIIEESRLKHFLQTLSKGEVYWDQEGGFWIAWSQIRYIQIRKANESKNTMEPDKSSHP